MGYELCPIFENLELKEYSETGVFVKKNVDILYPYWC